MVIQHNIAAMQGQRNLKLNNSNADTHLKRISTGYRINSAADDAAGLAVSEKMRAQIHGINQADRNALDGISLVQTAEGALQSVEEMIQRMRVLTIQALTDTTMAEDREKIDLEVQQLKAEIDRVSTTTEFNNMVLLDGSYSAELYTRPLPAFRAVIGPDLTDAGINDASFPIVSNPPTDDLYRVPKDGLNDSINFYAADSSGNYRVEYVNAGIRYEGTLNKSAIGSGTVLTLNQTSSITTSPPNRVSLDLDATVDPKILAGYLDRDYDYINIPVRTHAVTADLAPNSASNAIATLNRGYSVEPGGGYYDNLGFVADIVFTDPNRSDNMGNELERGGDSWTIPKSALDEAIDFSDTGISNVQLRTANWTRSTTSGSYYYNYKYSTPNNYTPSFYVSNVGGQLQYKMHAYVEYSYTETYSPTGYTYNRGPYGTYPDLTGSVSGDTVSFYYDNELLYSFDVSAAGRANLLDATSGLPNDSNFDVGAYCFWGSPPPSNSIGAFTGVDSRAASYPDFGGSHFAGVSDLTFDDTIVFNGGGTINFSLADDDTITASIKLTVLDGGVSKQEEFKSKVSGSQVTLENSKGQTIKFDIADLDSLKTTLEWGDVTGAADDAAPRYSVSFSQPQNVVSAKRQDDGSFYFELRKPDNQTVIMSGTCAKDAGTVTLDDSAHNNKGDKLTLDFATAGTDTLANYLRDDSPGDDSYEFYLSINTVTGMAVPTYSRASSRTPITYPTVNESDGSLMDNPINNLTITCGTGTTDFDYPNPPTITVRNSSGSYTVSVDTGEAGTYYWYGSGADLPASATATYGGKTITVSGLDSLKDYLPFYGDSLTGTLEWVNLQQPYIEVNGLICARTYPGTEEVMLGKPLWLQTGANAKQGLTVAIDSARIADLGHPVSLSEVSLLTRKSCTEALGILDSALVDLVEIRANLGAYQNRLEYTINALGVASINLTASESRIRDTDMAGEMSEYTRGNVLAQAGVSILAQANMHPQKLLQLLR